jgi:uncharacterized Zn finger protein
VTPETLEDKAKRYLGEGRVRVRVVTPKVIEANVQGSRAAAYKTRREGRRWSCDCPAWQRRCCHVAALELVT